MGPLALSTLLALACTPKAPDSSAPDSAGDTQSLQQTSGADTQGGAVDTGPADTAPPDTAPADTAPADTAPADTAASYDPPEDFLLQFTEGRPPTNVLMISVDTLRRDFIGRYSDEPSLTPNIDQLLSASVVLDHHRSCSDWTYPSILCALGGQYDLELGMFPSPVPAGDEGLLPVSPSTPIVSGILRDHGYRASLVGTNPYLSENFGFDSFYDTLNVDSRYTASTIVQYGLETLQELKDSGEPWMLHLHFYDPHSPYDPPKELIYGEPTFLDFDLRTHEGIAALDQAYSSLSPKDQTLGRDYARRMYGAEVAGLDRSLSLLLEVMEAAGDLDDTLIVFWTDHGEQLFDRGELEHAHKLHSEESDAVVAFWTHDIVPLATTIKTTHRDIAPTMLTAMGIELPEAYTGRVLKTTTEDTPIFSAVLNLGETGQSVDLGDERLIYSWSGELQYYNLAIDPGERSDLYTPDSAAVQRLWKILEPEVAPLSAYYDVFTPVAPIVGGG